MAVSIILEQTLFLGSSTTYNMQSEMCFRKTVRVLFLVAVCVVATRLGSNIEVDDSTTILGIVKLGA